MSGKHGFQFDNSYATELEGFYTPWEGDQVPDPAVVKLNYPLCYELGLNAEALDSPEGAALFAGSVMPDGAAPLAQAYAGHQFGMYSPRLGDGRALLVGEIIDRHGKRRDLHLKGSGRTPFSRGGDGKAVLGPVLREYMIGEAMHGLRVPTTRALAAVTTGEAIARERVLPGAVLARVAASHLRVGTFQFIAAQRDIGKLQTLADYAIRRHDPHLVGHPDKYMELLQAVMRRQAALVAKWMAIGFIHGVMNTDNMTLSGETIDYGPCAFMDHFDPGAVFSSIDHMGRYAYQNQPGILQWNIARFAETLLPLIDRDDIDKAIQRATEEVNQLPHLYQDCWLQEMRAKLGLQQTQARDLELVTELHRIIATEKVDYIQLFRQLADSLRPEDKAQTLAGKDALADWRAQWRQRLASESADLSACADAMDAVNPVYIPRNHLVEEAIQAAENDTNYAPFEMLVSVLENPFTKRPGLERFAEPAPESFGPYMTFCGT